MACEEEKAKVLNIRIGLVHLAESIEKLVHVFSCDAVVIQILVEDELIRTCEAKLYMADKVRAIFSCLKVILDKWKIHLCLDHISLLSSFVNFVVQVLHDKSCEFYLWNNELAFVLFLISKNLHG
jgi:hypothetical protein